MNRYRVTWSSPWRTTRGRLEELPLHPQLGVLPPQPGQLLALGRAEQVRPLATVGLLPADPAAHRLAVLGPAPGRPGRSSSRCCAPARPRPAGSSGGYLLVLASQTTTSRWCSDCQLVGVPGNRVNSNLPAGQGGVDAAPATLADRLQAQVGQGRDRRGAQQRVAQLEQGVGAAGEAGVQLVGEGAKPREGEGWHRHGRAA
jgi:hypothetical protein